MSALLDIVSEARDLRDAAERELRAAIVRASSAGHSLREIGRAAGLTHAGIAYILRGEEEK